MNKQLPEPKNPESHQVLVRIDTYSGSDLDEVLFMEVDPTTAKELSSFADTGFCSQAVTERLASLMEEALPALRDSATTTRPLDKAMRHSLCAAFVQRFGKPVETAARFLRQLK